MKKIATVLVSFFLAFPGAGVLAQQVSGAAQQPAEVAQAGGAAGATSAAIGAITPLFVVLGAIVVAAAIAIDSASDNNEAPTGTR